MNSLPKIEINTDGIIAHIKVDGNDVCGVRGYVLTHNAGEIPVLHLDLIATNLTVDGVMLPELPDVFKPFYKEVCEEGELMEGD
jgi:hypothetical protein